MSRIHLIPVALVALCAACDSGTADAPATPIYATTDRFEIRISETQLDANGHTKREVFVYGIDANGETATDDVVLGLDRASAGSYVRSTLTLGPLGARTHFIPCNETALDCVGAATLTLARANAPQVILAMRAITLVPATHISTAAPCRTGGNVVYVDGQGTLYNNMATITDATWQTEAITMNGQLKEVQLRASANHFIDGRGWTMWIDTYGLTTPLAPGYYLDAERSHFATTGHPGLDLTSTRTCTAMGSSFEVHDLTVSGNVVTSATVTFEHHCAGGSGVIEGCFHYAQ